MAKTFQQLAAQLGELVATKNANYGNSATVSGALLERIFPHGVHPEQYRDLLLMARVLDKLLRIANKKDAFGESPWFDLAGYALIGWKNDLEEREEDESGT